MSNALFLRGVEQFNAGRFFDAHESWEEVWLAAAEPERTYLQGLIQIAAAFHHYRRGNLEGARSLLQNGLKKLSGGPQPFRGIHLEKLREAAAQWVDALTGTPASVPIPRIELAGPCPNLWEG